MYLNHASIGPLPERTRLTLDAFNRRRAMPFQLPDRELFATLTESRRLLAGLIGATPEEIALTVNTSFGLGVVARALPLRAIVPDIADRRVVVVVGHEGDGVSADTLDACTHQARIPMTAGVDSLNVATAAAIAMYELME